MKTIFITGATGFLGKHLVDQLNREGSAQSLRVLCRGKSPWDGDSAVQVVHGDITSRDDVAKACQGLEEIYHLAGIVSRDSKDAELLFRTHIEGTRNICEEARRQGVHKIVVVSSSGTIAVSEERTICDETAGYKNDLLAEWPYYLSKIFAEKLALDYAAQGSPVVVVNPSLLLGPGDDRNSSTRDVALFLRGQIQATPVGGLNFVDARDAAAGLIAAMRSGKPGERYLLGGVNWTFRQLIEAVAGISGRHPPRFQPSLAVALRGARILRRFYRLIGKSFDLDDASIKMSALFWYCDSSKACRELGFQSRDPIDTLKDTVADVRRRLKL